MDFQEAFLALYQPAWFKLLGLYVATVIMLCIYHILMQSHRFARPRKRETFAGQEFN